MDRLTEKFEDGRNILRKGIADVFHVGFGRFFAGNAVDKLAEYEDLEEQGKLLKLPAAIGDEIFFIFMDCPKDFTERYCTDHEGGCAKCNHRVAEIVKRKLCPSDILNLDKIFLTQEAAEAALEEMSE